MRGLWVVVGVVVLGLAGSPGPASAWAWATHRLIAFRAMEVVGAQLPLPAERAWAVLEKAAVAPDGRGEGRLPPQDHVYHVTPSRRGEHFGRGPLRVQKLVDELLERDPGDERLVFELGRVCHLVADLCQPLHTDGSARNAGEPAIHKKYESDADGDCELLGMGIARGEGTGVGSASWGEAMIGLAVEANAGYDAVCQAYEGGGGYGEVRALTRRQVERATAWTVGVWRHVLARRGVREREREWAVPLAYVLVVFVMGLFALRGRVAGEAARWPGAPDDRDEVTRVQSARAFAALESRVRKGSP